MRRSVSRKSTYCANRDQCNQTKLNIMNTSVRYSSDSNLNKQIMKLPSESEDLASYNIFKIIASICNACLSKICEYLPSPPGPTLAKTCKHKPCNCKECIAYLDHIEHDRIELRLLYENKSRNELDHIKYKNNNCKPCIACKCSNNQAKSITHAQWQKMPRKNPAPFGDGGQFSQLGRLGKPYEKYIRDFHNTSVENYPLVVQGKHVGVYNPICDKLFYICGRCDCKNNSHLERYLGDNLDPEKHKCTSSSVCKCTLCECLSCPFQEEASFSQSLERFKTSNMCSFIENEYNLRGNEHEIQACRTAKISKHFRDSPKIVVSKTSGEKRSVKCNKHYDGRKSGEFSQQASTSHKLPVKEMLDNVYAYNPGFEIEENDKNPNKILTDQLLKNKYGVYAVKNHETNTEKFTAEKWTETVNLSPNERKNKVKNYEYTLKIEIVTPNFDGNTKEATKQRIKRTSKNKIKEQTQKVMKDVIKDISKNSLLQDMQDPENSSALQPSDNKILTETESEDQNKRRSILKKNSPISLKSTATENQNSSDMVTSLPRSSKVEDLIVGCVAPLQNTNHSRGKGKDLNKLAIPSEEEFVLSKNYWSPVPPAYPSMMTAVEEVEKLVSCVDESAVDVKRSLRAKSDMYLEDLRVREPCLRRVSHHTVSLKWKLPKLVEEIMGYEILVDGKTIEKILNPKRCLAVVSCLPPVKRLIITIRTLPKNPELRGLYPCTTIGYQPRANKF